ncbi:hypothetical protein AVEN_137250-1 [Araneus ventricosus]|uniref:Uncharacterized protein n=1 Tax=Araneus ventricosus TaxID=182803 RepID=A0A4Y2DRT5_ARAVE|nr:hypothetical protein AVEN_137250-1 [Araneus ventricosus]
MAPTTDLERKFSANSRLTLTVFYSLNNFHFILDGKKAFRLLTLPILNLRDINNSNDIRQMELKKVKECVVYVSHLLAVLSDTREKRWASPLKCTGMWLSNNRSFVDPPIVTKGDGLKMTITA